MYIYHALINALSAHMIHINLNMIFYTQVEHSPTKTIDIKYYKIKIKKRTTSHTTHKHTHTHTHNTQHTHTHTHTHTLTDCSRNWVLILGWKYCEKRKVFSLALKDDRVEQCLKSCGSKIPNVGSKAREGCESHESCVCIVGFPACGCQKKSVVYETECRHAAVQRGKQDQNHL